MSSKIITLKSSDGESFDIDEAVAVESQTIKHLIEDECATDGIPVPNVTRKILAKVIEYCKKHVEAANPDEKKVSDEDLKTWDLEFVKVDQVVLFDLILGGDKRKTLNGASWKVVGRRGAVDDGECAVTGGSGKTDLTSGPQNSFLALQEPMQDLLDEGNGSRCHVELGGVGQSEKGLGDGVMKGAEMEPSGCRITSHEGRHVSHEVLNAQCKVALEGHVGVTDKELSEGELREDVMEAQSEGEVGVGDIGGSRGHVGDVSCEEELSKGKRINEENPWNASGGIGGVAEASHIMNEGIKMRGRPVRSGRLE
ncbi:hypothetical protein K1719_044754 [Acacia pycnantha]|nr:hypothetical protein K1719_044754 [Acacia pycnantha]